MRASIASLALAVVALLLLVAAGPLYRAGVPLATAFSLMRWGAYAGVGATLVSLATAAWAYRRHRRRDLAIALTALLGASAAWLVPALWLRSALARPVIHDISTDLLDPPGFSAIVPLRADAENGLERTAEVNESQRRGYPGLQPVTVSGAPETVFDRALAVAQELDWRIVSADRGAGRIEATATTFWFGFKDDVVVRLTPWGAGTRVDVRSVSRVGRGDAGTNARRIEAFQERLQER